VRSQLAAAGGEGAVDRNDALADSPRAMRASTKKLPAAWSVDVNTLRGPIDAAH
jgi:hypothetical protein